MGYCSFLYECSSWGLMLNHKGQLQYPKSSVPSIVHHLDAICKW
jgi:hypothetical protein